MSNNKSLHKAAQAQQDEFYTQYTDVQEELNHYWDHFRGAKILCNCDDPFESSFFLYLAQQFAYLGIKKLTATCYAGSPIAQRQLSLFEEDIPTPKRKPYCATITDYRDWNGDGRTDLQDIRYMLEHQKGCTVRVLEGDGDFRSPECIELLKDADIVITNPPFSLLREYIAQLVQYNKKFLIVGNVNAITYKDIFPLFMQGRMWLGYHSGDMSFTVPDSFEPRATRYWVDETGQKWRSLGNLCWFTNLDIVKRHEFLTLWHSYSPEAYPRYDNYDAIEVRKVELIPVDYDGVMGVPVSFLSKHNPDQFELLGDSRYHDGQDFADDIAVLNGKKLYRRLLIRVKQRDGFISMIHHGGSNNEHQA